MSPEKIVRAPHIEALTALRGVLAWWVVAYHFREAIAQIVPPWMLALMASGDLAVDAFFVLSGFVLFLNHGGQFDRGVGRAALSFYIARIARVYPLHAAMLFAFLFFPLVILTMSTAKHVGERYDAGYFILNLLAVHNWGIASQLSWNIPSWSISAELFAYMLFPPLVLYVLNPIKRRAGRLFGLAVLAASVLGGVFSWFGASSLGAEIPRLGVVRCVCEFAIGCAAAAIWRLSPRWPGTTRAIAFFCFGVASIAARAGVVADYWLMPLAFGALILVLATGRPDLPRHLVLHVAIWLGQVSYATYMVHYFSKDLIKLAMPAITGSDSLYFLSYVAVTLALSALGYYFVEIPAGRAIREWGARWMDRMRIVGPDVPRP